MPLSELGGFLKRIIYKLLQCHKETFDPRSLSCEAAKYEYIGF